MMINLTENFIDAVRAELKKRRMTQKQLADLADITPAAVSHYFNGKCKPTLETALRICEALGWRMIIKTDGDGQ